MKTFCDLRLDVTSHNYCWLLSPRPRQRGEAVDAVDLIGALLNVGWKSVLAFDYLVGGGHLLSFLLVKLFVQQPLVCIHPHGYRCSNVQFERVNYNLSKHLPAGMFHDVRRLSLIHI